MAFVPDTPTKFVPDKPPDAIGEANLAASRTEHSPVQDVIDMIRAVPSGLLPALKGALGTLTNPVGTVLNASQAVRSAAANPSATLSSIGDALRNATPQQVGANVIAPAVLGGAVTKGVGLAADAADTAAAAVPKVAPPLGMRTGESNPIARNIAGESAQPTVAAHNQAIAEPALGAQAGVPIGTKIDSTSLQAAREAPNSVYGRAANAIPAGPLSPNAAGIVNSVGGDDLVVRSPNVQAMIDAQKQRLLSGNLTGPQVVDAQRALRFNGFKGINSLDPEQQAIGKAQLSFSDALHQHMLDTLQENAPVTADQLTAARTALAQNHTVENLISKGGDLDLQKLAKMHRENPGLLSGPMADIAQFASDHPEVTSLPANAERFNPSGFVKDVAGVNPLERPVGSVAQLFGGHFARKALTGGAPPVPDVPVTGLGGEFGPIAPRQPPPLELTPSEGQAFTPAQQPLTPPAAPYQPPLGLGAPLRPVAPGTSAEGLTLSEPRTYGGQPPNNSDLGAVMSQGVPEGTMTRSPPPSAPEFARLGQPTTTGRANNASGESAASLEDQNTPKQNLIQYGPDDVPKPIMKSTGQKDVNPDKGHIIIDQDTGEIHKSGNLAPRLAQGLLARWKALHGSSLGNEF